MDESMKNSSYLQKHKRVIRGGVLLCGWMVALVVLAKWVSYLTAGVITDASYRYLKEFYLTIKNKHDIRGAWLVLSFQVLVIGLLFFLRLEVPSEMVTGDRSAVVGRANSILQHVCFITSILY